MNSRLYSALAFAGATPFLACAFLPLFGVHEVAPFGSLDILVSSYGLGILSFLAGAHWATYLFKQDAAPLNLFISSNVVFLFVWFAYVLAGLAWVLASQLLAFLLLLYVDHRLLRAGLIPHGYFRVRAAATALASVSLLVILLTP